MLFFCGLLNHYLYSHHSSLRAPLQSFSTSIPKLHDSILVMRSFSIFLALMSITSRLTALPVTDTDLFYVELYREKAGNGTLIYSGYREWTTSGNQSVPQLMPREDCAGKPTFSCDRSSQNHGAPNNLCDQLVTELQANDRVAVSEAPRQICFQDDTAQGHCCVSWNKAIKNLTKGDLFDKAQFIAQRCTSNGVSGKLDNMEIQDTCVTVCLSNRGTGCK